MKRIKRMLAALAACGLGSLTLAVAARSAAVPAAGGGASPATRPGGDGKLVVHEWGTFTGFAGSDGVHLPFGTTVGENLPPFVLSRLAQAQRQGVKVGIGFLLSKGGGLAALQRMETPVVYFYADRPRDVAVRVDFPRGLLTEFYPPVRGMTPAFGDAPGEFGALDKEPDGAGPATQAAKVAPATRPAAKFERGSLDWGTVQIIPKPPGGPPDKLPEVPIAVGATGHYRYARETDAALVRFADRPGEAHDERFLFYRGLGDFALPVTLTAAGDGRFELTNAGDHPVRFALLLEVAGDRARFATYANVAGRRAMTLPAGTVALGQVGDAIAQALVGEGLYEREARAMVKTWSANWLGEPGTRVLYTVPRAVTDNLLPLRVSPTPDETVRVLVGRIDVTTPEREARVQSLLATAAQTKALGPEDAAYFRGLGRFVDPAIERAAKLRGGVNARPEVDALRALYFASRREAQAATAAPAGGPG
jgi:hypothetical protein